MEMDLSAFIPVKPFSEAVAKENVEYQFPEDAEKIMISVNSKQGDLVEYNIEDHVVTVYHDGFSLHMTEKQFDERYYRLPRPPINFYLSLEEFCALLDEDSDDYEIYVISSGTHFPADGSFVDGSAQKLASFMARGKYTTQNYGTEWIALADK